MSVEHNLNPVMRPTIKLGLLPGYHYSNTDAGTGSTTVEILDETGHPEHQSQEYKIIHSVCDPSCKMQ